MSSPNLQGWSGDPFGLHEARYFSMGRPTKLVRDGKVESYDEPPSSGPYEPAGAVAVTHAPGFGAAAVSRAPAVGTPRSAVGTPRPAGWSGSPAPGRSYLPAGRPRMLRPSVLAAVVALAVLTLVGALLRAGESRSSPGKPASSPAAFVAQSAHRTLAQRAAEMTLSGTIQVAGRSAPLAGTGETDFGTGATEISMDFSISGQPVAEGEVLVGGNLYLTRSIDGKSLSQVTGGRAWIQLPAGQAGSAYLSGSDPISPLAVLEQPGLTVDKLGTTIIDGVICSGYAVTPTKRAILAGAREESARLGFSSAMTSRFSSMMASLPPPTYRVWFDAQGLLRQMDMNWQMTALGAMSASATVNLSHYGSPVQITAPAPSDVTSESSLLRSLSHDSSFCLAQC